MRLVTPAFSMGVLLVAFSSVNRAAEPGTDAGKAKMKQFQGTWQVVAATKDGKSREAEKGGTLTFSDDIVAVTLPDQKGIMKLRVDFDQPGKEMLIAFQHWEGQPSFGCALDLYGNGLYEIERDSLKISFLSAFAWPKDLSDKGQVLWVLKKKAKP